MAILQLAALPSQSFAIDVYKLPSLLFPRRVFDERHQELGSVVRSDGFQRILQLGHGPRLVPLAGLDSCVPVSLYFKSKKNAVPISVSTAPGARGKATSNQGCKHTIQNTTEKTQRTQPFVLKVDPAREVVEGGFGRAVGPELNRRGNELGQAPPARGDRDESGRLCAGFEEGVGRLEEHDGACGVHGDVVLERRWRRVEDCREAVGLS